jgi:hypothetical protein
MNPTLLKLRESILNVFGDMIEEHGTNCHQGLWLQWIDQQLNAETTNRLAEIDKQVKEVNFNLEEMIENKLLSVTHKPIMADIFMHTADLVDTCKILREQYGPKY